MPNPSILRKSNRLGKRELRKVRIKSYNEEDNDIDNLEPDENPCFEEEIDIKIENNIKIENDIKIENEDDDFQTYELVQNYTNEYLLVPSLAPISENYRTDENIDTNIKENENNERSRKQKFKETPKPPSRAQQIKKLKRKKQVCTEEFHEVDIFTIFGKSVGDQLRSFPIDKAINLQHKIQDLITEERLML